MSHDMQEQFDPGKPNEAMTMAFNAYFQALVNTLESADEAINTLTEARVIEKAKAGL